ncbi:hypothetical protein Btru_040958 [Bulinus truncatus]|nr:hypothetical protein Btru_040958 [Bulinus truncatus]
MYSDSQSVNSSHNDRSDKNVSSKTEMSNSDVSYTCTPTMFVSCDSNVTNESITNETFGIALLEKTFWINAETFSISPNANIQTVSFKTIKLMRPLEWSAYLVWMNDSFRPAQRWPHQLFVASVWEPPYRTDSNSLNDRTTYWSTNFNLTCSYRTDSDIFVPYGQLDFVPKPAAERPNYYEMAKKKTKWALWFVSRCPVHSARDKYVQQMQKIIQVDKFGRCGKPCPNRTSECSETFFTEYRYYLSFENSLCKDYMTEKFFKNFIDNKHILPVVRGSFEYDKYLPDKTFINTAHFKNATQLALFLKRLGEDPLAYSKYLERKDQYRLKTNSGLDNLGCQACKFLHTRKLQGNVSDLKKSLVDDQCHDARDL